MEDDAKLRQAWIDWIDAQYMLADSLLPALSSPPTGSHPVELPLGAAGLMDRRDKSPDDASARARKRR